MVIESDGPALESCGDHHDAIIASFHRVIDLTIRTLPQPPPKQALTSLKNLATRDDYGTRRPLVEWINALSPPD